jgi:hypothetical protein
MANTQIQSEQIADNAITEDKIATNSVTSAKVLDGATGPQITSVSGVLTPSVAGDITITGVGFSGSNVFVDVGVTTALTAATSVTNTNSTSLTATIPALSAGTYKLYVVNSDGKSAMFPTGVLVSVAPTWTTAAGALDQGLAGESYSATVAASSDSAITYSVKSGSSLPSGLSLNSSTGVISGTMPSDSSSTTYNFTLTATDAESQEADRAFSIYNLVVDKAFVFTGGSLPTGITHSRTESSSTVASYYDSSGYLAFASAGDERFTHAWNGSSAVAQGILLEEQRQNWFWDSETPLQNNWGGGGHSRTISTVTNQTLPTGSTGNCTSYAIGAGTNTNAYQYHTQWGPSITGAGWYSFSFYGKRTSGNAGVRIRVYDGGTYYMRATFKFTDGTVNNVTGECQAEMEELPNGWYRCKMSGYTATAATGSPAHFTFETGNEDQGAQSTGNFTASQFYFWGFQFESGRGCTSYIKNLNTGVSSANYITRNSDYLRVAGTDWSNVITADSGRTYSAVLSGRAPTRETNAHLLDFMFSGGYNSVMISTDSSTSASDTPFIKGFSTEGLNVNVGNFTSGEDFKVGFIQTVSGGGMYAAYNGSSSSNGTSLPTPTQMTIGQYDNATGGFGMNGSVKYVYLFNSDIGNSLLQTLTT